MDFKYLFNLEIIDNPLSPDEPVFRVYSAGTANLQRIIKEIMSYNPGISRETIAYSLALERKAIRHLLKLGCGLIMNYLRRKYRREDRHEQVAGTLRTIRCTLTFGKRRRFWMF